MVKYNNSSHWRISYISFNGFKENNITYKEFLDTGAGSSYASSALLVKVNVQPIRKQTKPIEFIMPSIKIDVFEVEIEDVSESFQFKSEVSKLKEKPCYRFLTQTAKQFLNNISMIWVKKQHY